MGSDQPSPIKMTLSAKLTGQNFYGSEREQNLVKMAFFMGARLERSLAEHGLILGNHTTAEVEVTLTDFKVIAEIK